MHKALEIFFLIAVPMAWGLLVEFFFEYLRRRRNRKQQKPVAKGDELP